MSSIVCELLLGGFLIVLFGGSLFFNALICVTVLIRREMTWAGMIVDPAIVGGTGIASSLWLLVMNGDAQVMFGWGVLALIRGIVTLLLVVYTIGGAFSPARKVWSVKETAVVQGICVRV